MESGLGKSGGSEKSRRSKGFDVSSKKGGSRIEKRKGVVEDNVEVGDNDSKKKIKKEAFMSSFEVEGKSSFDKESGDGVSLEKSAESEGDFGFGVFSAGRVPKGPRGVMKNKNSESSLVSSPPLIDLIDDVAKEQVSENVGSSSGEANSADEVAKSGDGVKDKIVTPKSKGKVVVAVNKKIKKKSSGSSRKRTSAPVPKTEEEVHLVVNNSGDDASYSKKKSSRNRKRKDSDVGSAKGEPADDTSLIVLADSDDGEEDNLEENAARMLSSRFDPSCTQSSPKSRSPGTNGLSMVVEPDEPFTSRNMNTSAGLEFESGDLADRVLRPRKKHKDDDISRRRRHFYEIFYKDADAYWVLNKRIKVFWPLDESWYYGSVIDYCPHKKQHHIKYDDRDEEWIDLRNERIKLLLLPSEVPRKTEQKGDASEENNDEHDKKDRASDDRNESSDMDSVPLITWVGLSSEKVKSSRLGASKGNKTLHLSPKSSKKLSIKAGIENEYLGMSDPSNKLSCDLAGIEGSSSVPGDGKSPVVYVRRRFRKNDKQLIDTYSTPTMVTAPSGSNNITENDVSHGLVELKRFLLSFSYLGMLKLTTLVDWKKLRLEDRAEDYWWLRALFLLKYGTVSKLWPEVNLEVLFVDNVVGLRFAIFEGSLKQAVEFVLLVMAIFNWPNQTGNHANLAMPVTSVSFKLSCLEDRRRRHVFSFYSFTEVKGSKWLYLDSELQQHCLVAKQLPLSECTYDNINALETGSIQPHSSSGSQSSSANEGLRKESAHGVIDSACNSFQADLSPSQFSVKQGKLLPLSLSFSAAAPSCLLSLHLKLLMDTNVASITPNGDMASTALHGCTPVPENITNNTETSVVRNCEISVMEVESLECTVVKRTWESDTALNCGDDGLLPDKHQNGKSDVAYTSARSEYSDKEEGDAFVKPLETESAASEPKQAITTSKKLFCKDVRGLTVEVPDLQPDEVPFIATPATATQPSLKGNGPKSLSLSSLRPGGNPKFIQNGFISGPKKPRTQVEYTLPSVGLRSSSKNSQNRTGLPFQRIRKPNDKKGSESVSNFQRKKGFLACDANVLITAANKGWREYGAHVELESADHNEWKLVVKFSGVTKFSHKAYQLMQPGSTNRFTHAMMWRGGDKDWALEFPDRNQWFLFKEMYEECLNRNLRAASKKNIPIPGVRLIEEYDANGIDSAFVRSSSGYLRQVETDAEMAMDPSHILYDMDSEDEMWISVHGSEHEDLSEELFERAMDMLEKVAFAKQCEDFELDEVEEVMAEIGPMESIRSVYEHWQKKRLAKGMPLIRHLQPPLWETYARRVKEWEQVAGKSNSAISSDRAQHLEKPPTFAFCSKPRGLEMRNKGSKQRSQRRHPVSGHSYSHVGDHDGYSLNGRRAHGNAHGEGTNHEYLDISPSFKPKTRVFSPREAGGFGQVSLSNGSSERNHYPKFSRNKSKSVASFRSPNVVKVSGPCNQRAGGRRNGGVNNRLNAGVSPKLPTQKGVNLSEVSLRYGVAQLDGADIDEFKLRDAPSAAKHAHNMARLKREDAQRLHYKSDLRIFKAVSLLINAEACKAAHEDLNDDGEDDDTDDDESTEEDDDDTSGDDLSDDESDDSEDTR